AHARLLSLAPEQCERLDFIAGDHPGYDVFIRRVVQHVELEELYRGSGSSERRFLVSWQRQCSGEDARFLTFLAQFVPIDVLGACAKRVTWNTEFARARLRRGQQWKALALISDSSSLGRLGAAPAPEVWEALAAGAVPVYWGAHGLSTWLPGVEAAVEASKFASPLALAALLQDLKDEPQRIQRYHSWRQDRPLSCDSASSASWLPCLALAAQAPVALSWQGMVSLSLARLSSRNKPAALFFRAGYDGTSPLASERRWRRACGALLPQATPREPSPVVFQLQILRASEGLPAARAGDESGVRIIGEGEVLDVTFSEFPEAVPQTPMLRRQWHLLRGLVGHRELFEGSSVLQLGLRPRDALPLVALGAAAFGGASSILVYTPEWGLRVLSQLSGRLEAHGHSRLLRIPAEEDFRQLRPGAARDAAASLWLEAGRNEFLRADVVLALGSTLPLALGCLGLQSLHEVVGMLRHLASTAVLIEWIPPESLPAGEECGIQPDQKEIYNLEALLVALREMFQHVSPVGTDSDGSGFWLCIGPKQELDDWARIRIVDTPIPDFKAAERSHEVDRGVEEVASSGFLWAGEVFTKRVQSVGGQVRKVTSSLMALKEAMFLSLFAADSTCVPKLLGHQHGRAHNSDGTIRATAWWSMLMMEHIVAPDLVSYVQSVQRPEDILGLLHAALDLLRCLGQHGIRHNDLWASNLFVLPAGGGVGLRLVAIDFGASELIKTGPSSMASDKANAFLKSAGVEVSDLPQLVPRFFVADGDAAEVSVDCLTDRCMLGAVLEHHLLKHPVNQVVAGLAALFRHAIEALATDGGDEFDAGDREGGGHGSWSLEAVRDMLGQLM
ncbi:unnamed protein product, partial [Polarella glacialis]